MHEKGVECNEKEVWIAMIKGGKEKDWNKRNESAKKQSVKTTSDGKLHQHTFVSQHSCCYVSDIPAVMSQYAVC